MKRTRCFFLLSLIVLLNWGFAQEIKPVAVSPGSERGVARVSDRCPTFSWSAIGWAAGYRVAVFEAKSTEVRTYESMALAETPVLTQDIPGKALSWTPSEGVGLKDGGLYIWYVQARDASGNGLWSAGKAFRVELDRAAAVGIGERDAKKQRTRGVAAGASSEAPGEDRPAGRPRAISRDFSIKKTLQTSMGIQMGSGGPGAIRTQGNEGDAQSNTYYGTSAGSSLDGSGYSNSFFGYSAGRYTTGGDDNTFMGSHAGESNTTGSSNTFLGYFAGWYNTTGFDNTFLGYDAGYSNTTGDSNVFLGIRAGFDNTTGCFNTFLGYWAGYFNSTGNSNTFLGYYAGQKNTASFSTAVGHQAGCNNTSGYFNTFVGYKAGYTNSAGDYNTALGVNAGYSNSTGLRNVFLGYSAGYSETGSEKLYIANSPTVSPLIWGDFSAGIVNINGKLGVEVKSPVYPLQMKSGAKCTAGGVWTNASSRTLKENIRDLTAEDAQAALEDLTPVRFNYKTDATDECLGFIAEDVPSIVATGDREGLSPMDIVAVLTKVAQEQQRTISEQQKTIDELRLGQKAIVEQQKINAELRAEIEALKNKVR